MQDRISNVEAAVASRRQAFEQARAQKDVLTAQVADIQREISTNDLLAETALKSRRLLEALTDTKRELIREKIEALVTHGLQAVFGSTYSFKIEQKTARNQVTFEYQILHEFNGQVRTSDLRGYHGGGLVALVGFLLRLVMVLFTHPSRRRILFLDETFANLDADKREPLARLLLELGSQLECQFVLITHSPEYTDLADRAYEVVNSNGSARLNRIV